MSWQMCNHLFYFLDEHETTEFTDFYILLTNKRAEECKLILEGWKNFFQEMIGSQNWPT